MDEFPELQANAGSEFETKYNSDYKEFQKSWVPVIPVSIQGSSKFFLTSIISIPLILPTLL